MTISVLTIASIMILIVLGYQFNRKEGRLEQGGLLQLISTPSGATVTVDGQTLGSKTSTKLTTSAATHYVKMDRSGYRTWEKSITLSPGGVGWLNYARLIPNDTTPAAVANYTQLTSALATPDGKWFALKQAPDTPELTIANISGDTVSATTLALPVSSFSTPGEGKSQRFELVKWDDSSRYLLVKHSYGDSHEWLVVDRDNPDSTKNLTQLYGKAMESIVFADTSGHRFFALDGTNLISFDSDSPSASRQLAANIAEFAFYSDKSLLTYTTTPNQETKKRSVGYLPSDGGAMTAIRTVTDEAAFHVALGYYYDEQYIAVAHGDATEIIKGPLPAKDNDTTDQKIITTATLQSGVDHLSIITKGRFVVMQHADTYQVYDLELAASHTTTLKGESAVTAPLHWLDGYVVWSDRDGELRFYDFDGGNRQEISAIAPGYDVTLSPNGRYVYSIGKTADGYQLQRSRLILG